MPRKIPPISKIKNHSATISAARIAAISAITGAVAGGLATFGAAGLGYLNKNRDLDIKMIEIALGILREDPKKSEITAAREWAVDLLDEYSGKKLVKKARDELVKRPLKLRLFGRGNSRGWGSGGGDGTGWGNSSPVPKSGNASPIPGNSDLVPKR